MSPLTPYVPYVPSGGNDGELSEDGETFWGGKGQQSISGLQTPGQAGVGEAAEVVHQQRLQAAAAAFGAEGSQAAGGQSGAAADGG